MKNIIFDLGGVVVEWNAKRVIETFKGNPIPVSYTHLDVYKRQGWRRSSRCTTGRDRTSL